MASLAIRPGERLQGARAGIVSRVAAALVDVVAVAVIGVLAVLLFAVVRALLSAGPFNIPRLRLAGTLSTGPALLFAYLAFFWATTGRTLGTQLVGLRVVAGNRASLGPLRAMLRAALCVLFPVGLLWVVVSRRNESVQDLVLRTAVVYDWRPAARGSPSPGGWHS